MNRPLSPSRPRFPCPLAALLLSLVMLFAAAAPAVAQDEPAHQAFLFAYKLLQQGEDELAAEAFDDYLGDFADAPKRGDARYYRALLYRRAGKNEAAAAMLEKVAEPQLVAPYAVNLLRGQVLSDLKRYPQAIDALERIDAGQLEPEVGASVHHLRGIAYRGAGNLSAAAEQFEQAAELSEPRRGQALLDLARVQVRMDRLDDALATLDRVVELEAGQVAEAARLAGDLSYQHEQYGAAARYYARVARNHQSSPHFAPSVLGLLWSQFSAEQYGEVVASHEQFGEALDGENRGRAVYLAGSARQKLGEHERAIELLEQARPALTGSDLEARLLFRLASSQFSLGRFEAMRETAGELTRRRPDAGVRAQMQYLLALADARQGEVSQGVARLTRLIEQGTDAAYHRAALLRRAWLYEQHDQLEPAARDYARYLDAGDTGPEAHEAALRRIDLLLRLERYENVVTAADELLSQSRVAPSLRQQALYRLGLAQIRLDQAESALETLSHLQSEYPLNPFTAEADYYRGLLLMSLDRADEAAELLKKAASQESLAAGLRANAWRMVALRQREAGREDAAADSLAKLEEIAGRERLSADERLWLASYRLERGEFETALAYVERLTEMRPGGTPEQR
ncbi:MAG: tetratricopeptide repeat protein, partial [Phycisphaeraceae bacterium]